MTIAEVSNKIKPSLVKLLVIDKQSGKVSSQGSGVIIDSNGFILTAHHVVKSTLTDSSKIIMAVPHVGGGRFFYSLLFGGTTFNIAPPGMIAPMIVDLSILAPLQPVSIPHIQMAQDIPSEGIEVVMAGFPEDLRTPLDIAEHFKREAVGGDKGLDKIREFSYSIIPWLMIKHGIVGGVFHIAVGNMTAELLGSSVSFPLRAAEYWVDNTYAPGASGGPMVDMQGSLLGIITETGETTVSDFTETISFPVPSGSTRVLSHKLITWSLNELKSKWIPVW